ncbi:MAG: hypothetical protein LQ351_002725 [Letrouitia transgressa]|nr:MAG: hypothetical protein LQ351_002725 [Letrouitia transgressa]
MPAPAGTKRVKGVSIFRPFVYGSTAKPFPPDSRPASTPPDHTHQWTLYVRPISTSPHAPSDLTHFIKKVSFKLHETYANSLRIIESPPFQVTETGWGEFEVAIKLYFVPEANEKPQTLWHHLKLHPYGPDAEGMRERREEVRSQCYEEVVFNEPVEAFYDVLTGGGSGAHGGGGRGGKGGKGSKLASLTSAAGGKKGGEGARTAELPFEGVYSQKEEGRELDRLGEAVKTVEAMVREERTRLEEREKMLAELRSADGNAVKGT